MEDSQIWIIVSVLILLFLFAFVGLAVRKKHKRPVDYYNLFIIGLVWFAIGLPMENSALWAIGLVFVGVALANKSKWEKNRVRWKDLSEHEKYWRIGLIGFLALLLIAGAIVYFLH